MEKIINEEIWKKVISTVRFSGDVMFDEAMKNHTSLKIGGPAGLLVMPHEVISLKNLVIALKRNNIPFMVLGGGTNLLVRDEGIEKAVVSLRHFRRIEFLKEDDAEAVCFVEAGVPLQKFVSLARDKGYSGMEGLVGIPGLIGGAIAGNAGSYGYEMKNIIETVTLMYSDSRLDTVKAEDLGFGYRTSNISADTIILSAVIRLKKDAKEDIEKRMDGFLKEKRERHPMSEPSAGCVFKNPKGEHAGKLIQDAGCKGMRIGGAEVSTLHANYFINKGDATASDFMKLMDEVNRKVKEKFGIILEPEIKIVGRG